MEYTKTKKPLPLITERIHLLDEIRGFAILLMVLYHAFYTFGFRYELDFMKKLYGFFQPVQVYFALIFILVSGISSRLSKNNTLRGIKLLAIALAFTVVTVYLLPLVGINGAEIYFGILHCLSISMLIFSALKKWLNKIDSRLGVLVCILLYILTRFIGDGILGLPVLLNVDLPQYLFTKPYLFPLGIITDSFYSADYFPLLPYLFVFLAGTFIGLEILKGRTPAFMFRRSVPFLSFIGKHTLLIYIMHQPVIFLLGELMLLLK